MNKFSQKVIAGGMSLVLAVGLTPLPAFAATGDLAAAGSSKLVAQETKTISSVYWTVTSTHVYDGAVFAPEPTVAYYGTVLTKGTDYTVKYYDSSYNETTAPKEVGTYYAEVTGTGQYSGSDVISFRIADDSDDWDNLRIIKTDLKSQFAYTGSAIKPGIVVKIGQTTLTEGTDYKVAYQQEKWVGDDYTWVSVDPVEADWYRIEVTPAGKYATADNGPQTTWFSIFNPKDFDYADVEWPEGSDILYTGANLAPKPVVYMDGKELVENTDYTIKYQQRTETVLGYDEDGDPYYSSDYTDVTPNAVGLEHDYRAELHEDFLLGVCRQEPFRLPERERAVAAG